MNAYDFDGTIYDGDGTLDFYFFSLKRNRKLLLCIPKQLIGWLRFKIKLDEKTVFKEKFYIFLNYIEDIENEVQDFWKINDKKIKEWYKDEHQVDDIILSASPEFLLKPICLQLEIKNLIASKVDPKTGKYKGKNCYGKEKVERLKKEYGNVEVAKFYTDSIKSDLPMVKYAKRAYLVKKSKILSV